MTSSKAKKVEKNEKWNAGRFKLISEDDAVEISRPCAYFSQVRKSCVVITVCLLTTVWSLAAPSAADAYWIWAGVAPNDAPSNAHLYIYQGIVSGTDSLFAFVKKGIFAHPLKAQSVFLTYRVNGSLIDSKNLVKVFLAHADGWRRHKVNVMGLQVDFDAPSKKLKTYAKEMATLKRLLPADFQLSVTGLGDWAMQSDKTGLKLLFGSVDEIVFQMYRVNRHHENIKAFIDALESLRHPYKIGLLYDQGNQCDLGRRTYLNGVVYFIQRRA